MSQARRAVHDAVARHVAVEVDTERVQGAAPARVVERSEHPAEQPGDEAVGVVHVGIRTTCRGSPPSSATSVKPARPRMPRTRSGSASENGPGASAGGDGSSPTGRHRPGELADPLVLGERSPRRQRQASAGSHGASDVGERGDRIAEEHRAGAADDDVEDGGVERVDLGVDLLEADVADPLRGGSVAGRGRASAPRGRRRAPIRSDAARAASRVVCPVPHPTSSTRSAARWRPRRRRPRW